MLKGTTLRNNSGCEGTDRTWKIGGFGRGVIGCQSHITRH